MTPTTESTPLGTDSTQSGPAAPPPLRKFPLMPLVVFGVIIAGGVAGLALWHRRGPDPIQDAQQEIGKEHQDDVAAAKTHATQRYAAARDKWQEAVDEGQKILILLAEFDQELKQWNDSVVALLTNDRGKALAGDPDHIRYFRKTFQQRRPTKADGDAIRARVSALLEPLHAALAAERNSDKPDKETWDGLETHKKAVEDMIEKYRRPRREIESLVTLAQGATKPAAITLQQAIKDRDAQDADDQARLVAAAEETARKEGDKVLAEARAAKIRQETADKKKQIEEEQNLEAARAESQRKLTAASREAEEKRGVGDAARIREAAQKQVNTRLAQSAEVKALLEPLTTPGYWQPGVDASESTEKKAISLAKLRSYGALQDSPDGLQKLLTVGTKPFWNYLQDKVRPRWPWNPELRHLKPDELEQLKQAQEYLRKLDTTLVELGMLSE
jgi:hypothetical protein